MVIFSKRVDEDSDDSSCGRLSTTSLSSLHSISSRKSSKKKSTVGLLRSSTLSKAAKEAIGQLTELNFSDVLLFGREEETLRLRAAYEEAKRQGSDDSARSVEDAGPQVVFVSGVSGTGKSAMANQLQSTGKVTSGKFDFKGNAPYAAIIRAYEGVCARIAQKLPDSVAPEFTLQKLRGLLSEAFGDASNHGNPLLDMIPSLATLLDESAANEERSGQSDTPSQSKNRLMTLFRALTKALSQFLCPFVLVLDDLQWAGENELDVLKAILLDSSNSAFLFVGTFRSNEVREGSVFASWLEKVKSLRANFLNDIVLGSLPHQSVNDLISTVLRSEVEHTKSLADTVVRKTQGNPFYVIQFVTTLRDMGVLDFNLGAMKWEWSDEEVKKMFVTDNVSEILTLKLKNLGGVSRFICQVGACLGATFGQDLLLIAALAVQEHGPEDIREAQQEFKDIIEKGYLQLIDENILEQDPSGNTLSFAHDQIQLSSAQSIPKEEQIVWKECIGQALLEESDLFEGSDQWLFLAADLCDSAVAENTTSKRQVNQRLVELNWTAGKRAVAASAFIAAAGYLKSAISLIGDCGAADTNYSWLLDMHKLAAECEFSNGNYDMAKSHIDFVVSQDIPFDEKMRSYSTLVAIYNAQGKWSDSMATGISALNKYGIKMPAKASTAGVLTDLVKTIMVTKKVTADKIVMTKDKARPYAERIIDSLYGSAYISQPDYFPFLPLRHVQYAVKKGASATSPVSFVSFGFVLAGKLGKLKEGHRLGTLAIDLLARLKDKSSTARVNFLWNGLLRHWIEPAHLCSKDLQDGVDVGLQFGDTENAMYQLFHSVMVAACCGKGIDVVEKRARVACPRIRDEYNHKPLADYCSVWWQFTLNMMGKSKDPLVLDGEAMAESVALQEASDNGDTALPAFIHALKLQLAYYVGTPQLMAEEYDAAKAVPDALFAMIIQPRHVFFEGLVSFLIAETEKRGPARRKWLKRAARAKKQVNVWVQAGNVNLMHCAMILEGEHCALKGKREKAKKCYEQAIVLAGRSGYQQDRALAQERAALNALKMDDRLWASHHMKSAYEGYKSWGAAAKSQQLFLQHETLFEKMLDKDLF